MVWSNFAFAAQRLRLCGSYGVYSCVVAVRWVLPSMAILWQIMNWMNFYVASIRWNKWIAGNCIQHWNSIVCLWLLIYSKVCQELVKEISGKVSSQTMIRQRECFDAYATKLKQFCSIQMCVAQNVHFM